MKRYHIPQLGPDPDCDFPDPREIGHPEGLVAWGGDLEPVRLLNAYRRGVFPWYEHGSPILWWSPEPRAALIPEHWQPPGRLRRTLRQARYSVTIDTRFDAVIQACAGPRHDQTGTWITPAMIEAYNRLHGMGHAHSIEILHDGELSGGLYGVALGKIFFAESKFHHRRDASKIALAVLMRCLKHWDFLLADCQVWNPHLERLGVGLLSLDEFHAVLDAGVDRTDVVGSWSERLAGVDLTQW
jgi:leucyl/phenylalanyl-tRNA---protein transferase